MLDPQWVSVQVQIRMPFWRRAQLAQVARQRETTLAAVITDAINKVHKPSPPPA